MRKGRKLDSLKKYVDIDGRIEQAMIYNNLSQRQLALKIHCSNATINNYINGKPYDLETAKAIAHVLNIDYKYLTYDSDFKTREEALEAVEHKTKAQKECLFDLLQCHGYKIEKSDYMIVSNETVICSDTAVLEYPCRNKIYQVTTPNDETQYITESDLATIQKIIESTFDSFLFSEEHLTIYDQ